MKTLSITIVAYNDYDEIKQAVKSIENFTDKDISKTIYIVDNSDNNNKNIEFNNFLKKYDDIVYLHMGNNLGFAKGHNYVLERLNSKYHAIVNPDILFSEDVFKEIIEWMDNNKDVGMVIPDIRNEKGERQPVYREELTVFDMLNRYFLKNLFKQRTKKHTLQNKDYSKPFQVPFGQGSFLVIRTELFINLKGFDENFFMYCEDADLCKRVNQVSKLMYYPGAKVIHKWKMGSHKNKKLFKYHVNSMKYYFKKWKVKWI